MKICSSCRKTKPLNEFGRQKDRQDGRRSHCKLCIRDYNKTKAKSRGNWWKKSNETLLGKFQYFRQSSRRRKLKWNLSFEDFSKIPQVCYYTGLPLTLKRNNDHTLSLDRINSRVGYTKNNVVFCCSAVNYMKSDLTLKDFISFCRKVSKKFPL